MTENSERGKLSLRPIGPNWQLYRTEFGADDWKIVETGYLSKRVQRDQSGKLQWEEDYYYSGKTFVSINGVKYGEMLTIHYDYPSALFDINYSGEDLVLRDKVKFKGDLLKSKEFFKATDDLLQSWHLSRL